MPGSRPAAPSPAGDAPVPTCAASGPKMPGSGWQKRSKLAGDSRIASQEGDILVIGTGRRGTPTHLFSGRVSRYCLAHAHVPLVAIPPPALAAQLRNNPLSWAFWHRSLTPDRIVHDRGKTAA